MKKEVIYNVYNHNVNSREIELYNVFRNSRFYDGVCDAIKKYKKDKNFQEFKEEVRHQVMYSFWSKAEYEVVITSWPPYINVEDIDKLKAEVEEHDRKWKTKQLRINVNPTVGEKIDISDQILMNFDIFIDYILNNVKNFKLTKRLR